MMIMFELFLSFLRELAGFYNEIAVYLVFGFFIAALLHVFFPESFVRRHLGKRSMNSVLKSTLIGIPLPLCSCGVVPVAASLRKSGASKGATAAFLTSTPQIGADSFLITYSLLGGIFALFRIIASVLTAMLVGWWVNLFHRKEKEESASDPVASQGEKEMKTPILRRAVSILSYIEYELLGSLANSLVVGIVLAGVIAVAVPSDLFAGHLRGPLLLVVMLLVGIPMYVCASASTPIAAALVYKGMSPGAALVFLLTGPATNAVTITAVFRMLGKKAGAAYLTGIAMTALALGLALDYWVLKVGLAAVIPPHHVEMLPGWLKMAGSILLTGMLAWHYGARIRRRAVKEPACPHCAGQAGKGSE